MRHPQSRGGAAVRVPFRQSKCLPLLLVASTALLCLSLLPPALSPVHAADQPITWRQQIAPIVYKNCASCHHAGGSAPFDLTTYTQAKRWAAQMQTVTGSRYMPPWLPAAGHGDFAGDRRMSAIDIERIAAWVKAGAPEGEGQAPTPPVYAADWQLGKPDLILTMPQAVIVSAAGGDVFENFILPADLTATRWVRAMEIKPGPPQLTHHANVILDRTESLRRAHPADWQKGVPGMDLTVDSGDAFDPDSHFLFWKPDSTALIEPAGMPWRLDPGDDLVLNMHLKPTGKPESVQARIGLYFEDAPAKEHPMLLQLERDDKLAIPAGDSNFVVTDELTLPMSVDVLGIYPHAHYLGKRLEAWATLPNGERRWLVLIEDWDIDRQSVYRFARPCASAQRLGAPHAVRVRQLRRQIFAIHTHRRFPSTPATTPRMRWLTYGSRYCRGQKATVAQSCRSEGAGSAHASGGCMDGSAFAQRSRRPSGDLQLGICGAWRRPHREGDHSVPRTGRSFSR